MNHWRSKILILSSLIMFLSACMASSKGPLETLYWSASSQQSQNLIVFLRGMGGTLNCPTTVHRCFEVEGYVDAVTSRQLSYDMAAPNAHRGYYMGRNLVERLREDVILPAKAQGYEKIWIVGVSMGGLGALFYLMEHPEDIAGIVTLGPFLGYDEILDEIQSAGGVRRWEPGSYDPNEEWERMLWDFIKGHTGQETVAPPIIMGLATEDSYLKGHRLLANALDAAYVFETSGKHRMKTFKALWDMVLEKGYIQ